jgi:DNA-binding Lrp family transcriptional regulator
MVRLLAFLMLLGASPLPAEAQGGSQLALSAAYAGEGKVIGHGLVWRVFRMDPQGEPQLMTQSADATPVLQVPPGEYVVHVAYGFAGSTRKVLVASGTTTERVPLSAGGLMVKGSVTDQVIPANRLQISVFIPQPGASEGRMVTSGLRAGEVLRLPEGTYHVVTSYGDSNSIARADIRVTSGKTTEAIMNHRAATITLKLVSNPGGEARANTAWSVLTPGGDVIREAIGAFPSMTLAEGDYVAIARNDGSFTKSHVDGRSRQRPDAPGSTRRANPPGSSRRTQHRPTPSIVERPAMQTFFVKIKCQLGKTYQVATALADAEIASEIYSVAGEYDILAKFHIDNDVDIGHFVGERVQTIQGIQDTRTMITFKAF